MLGFSFEESFFVGRSEVRNIEKRFVRIANDLSAHFPELDLRFNWKRGSRRARFIAPEVTDEVFEMNIGVDDIERLLQEAIFTIKEVAKRFDD